MSDIDLDEDGFNQFSKLMEDFQKKVSDERITEVLKAGADELANEIEKRPKPRSKIAKQGYTHLLDSIAVRVNGKEVEVGWGKYYGPMVERGTKLMDSKEHVKPAWEENEDKCYKTMTNMLFE